MNSEFLYDFLENNNKADAMAVVSMILEYMVNNYGADFDELIQDLKVLHEVMIRRGAENE